MKRQSASKLSPGVKAFSKVCLRYSLGPLMLLCGLAQCLLIPGLDTKNNT